MIETLINDLGTQTGHMNNVCRLSSHKGSIEVIHILVYQGEEKSKRADSMHCVSTFLHEAHGACSMIVSPPLSLL